RITSERECGKRFALNQNLQSHMTSHSEERPFKCSVCEKSFKKDCILTNHMKTHRGDCSECGRKLKWKSLASHLRNVHHIFACSVCKERFTDNVGLKEHMMTHVEKFHICSVCGERFIWKTALLRHEREAHERS
uniref:C2H2-type domain-containing protein n=1 Tax=Neogobius melanostomus TaxID=47308 RepID=A0A8C6UBV7_9GOBI